MTMDEVFLDNVPDGWLLGVVRRSLSEAMDKKMEMMREGGLDDTTIIGIALDVKVDLIELALRNCAD